MKALIALLLLFFLHINVYSMDMASFEKHLDDVATNRTRLDEYYVHNSNAEQLRLLRNMIFAKKGYIFKDEKLFNYFNSKSWYKPVEAKEIHLDSVDKAELSLIEAYEESCSPKFNKFIQFFKLTKLPTTLGCTQGEYIEGHYRSAFYKDEILPREFPYGCQNIQLNNGNILLITQKEALELYGIVGSIYTPEGEIISEFYFSEGYDRKIRKIFMNEREEVEVKVFEYESSPMPGNESPVVKSDSINLYKLNSDNELILVKKSNPYFKRTGQK